MRLLRNERLDIGLRDITIGSLISLCNSNDLPLCFLRPFQPFA